MMLGLGPLLGRRLLGRRLLGIGVVLASSAALVLWSWGAGEVAAPSEQELEPARRSMVEQQLRGRDIVDPAVLEAMGRVPRHRFVPPALQSQAYSDGPLSIGEGQTISQPYIVALMTQLAKVSENARVLEVGTGSGYQAAILAELAHEVYTIEILPHLAESAKRTLDALSYQNIHFRVGDGYRGWPEAAPFDAILVTAAPDHIPQPLVDQLKIGGILVIPVGSWSQDLIQATKTKAGLRQERVTPVRFVPMTGEAEKH